MRNFLAWIDTSGTVQNEASDLLKLCLHVSCVESLLMELSFRDLKIDGAIGAVVVAFVWQALAHWRIFVAAHVRCDHCGLFLVSHFECF